MYTTTTYTLMNTKSRVQSVAPKVLAAVRKRYPKAKRFHLEIGGHFPYVTRPKAYIELFKKTLA